MKEELFVLNQDLIKEREFWKELFQKNFSDGMEIVHWPYDNQSKSESGANREVFDAEITASLYELIMKLTNRSDFLIYTFFLTCLAVCLHKYTGCANIPIGSPAYDDNDDSQADQAVVIFNQIFEDRSFKETINQNKDCLLKAYQHQHYPFKRLREDMKLFDQDARFPFFSILLAYHKIHKSIPRHGQDITLSIRFDADKFVIRFDYDAGLYRMESCKRFFTHYCKIMDQVLNDTNMSIKRIEMITDEEKNKIVYEWNNTDQTYNYQTTLHRLFEEQAARNPDRIALSMENSRLAFSELNRKANQLADYLSGRGIGPEKKVGIFLPRSLNMIIAIFAVWKAGGAYVPLNPEHPVDYLKFIIEDTKMDCIITDNVLCGKHVQTSSDLINLDMIRETLSGCSENNPRTDVTEQNLAYIIYTSGTTGKPKGTLIEHRSAVNLSLGLNKIIFNTYAEDGLLCISQNAPLSFDVSVKHIIQIINGYHVCIIPEHVRYDGDELIDYISQHRIRIFDCTPSHLKMLLNSGLLERDDLDLKAVLAGGEAIDENLWTILRTQSKIDFHNGYGPTECTVTATTAKIDNNSPVPHIGYPVPNGRIYILDRRLQPVPIGVTGEIHVGGAGVARGYLNRPELTLEKFIPDPFSIRNSDKLYKTGDLACYMEDGKIRFISRNDHQVKISGFRIELKEIELALKENPEIRDCLVMAKEIDAANRLVVYYISDNETLSTEALRHYLSGKLPGYMIPGIFIPISSLPLTPHGKVDYKKLPDVANFLLSLSSSGRKPANEAEQAIMEIWKKELRLEEIGMEDNFFDLGGYSLLLYKVRRKIELNLKVRLSTLELFNNPTIKSLAGYINSQLNTDQTPPPPVGESNADDLKDRSNRRKVILAQKKKDHDQRRTR